MHEAITYRIVVAYMLAYCVHADVVEMASPTSSKPTTYSIVVNNTIGCRWVKWTSPSGFSLPDENIYTTTVTTAGDITDCTPSWFAIGVPVDDDSSPPECHAAYSAGNPFKAAVTASVENCLVGGKIQYIGFYQSCSATDFDATVKVSLSEWCDKDKQTVWKILVWVIIAVALIGIGVGIYCCVRCCRKKDEDEKGADTMWIVQPNQASIGIPCNSPNQQNHDHPNVVINMVKEDDGLEGAFGCSSEDERRRLKAATHERQREERRASRMREETERQRAEMADWEAKAAQREREERQWKAEQERRKSEAANSQRQNEDETSNLLADAQVEIAFMIQEAYKLPEAERKKKIKDLRLRWHPDKNPMLKGLANDIMKIINREIEKQNQSG